MKRLLVLTVAAMLASGGPGLGAPGSFDPSTARASLEDGHLNASASGPGDWTSYRPALPSPVANNAVAAVQTGGDCWLMSALGIGASLDHTALTTSVYVHRLGDSTWSDVGPPPSATARVAASAVGLGGKIYLLGGFSVAANGSEASFADVDVYDPVAAAWSSAASLLVPVDDALAVAWRDRYIVVVSGWSHDDNVDAVQIYDATLDTWSAATPFPGKPVFGHAGGLQGNEIILIDGVERGPNGFRLVNQAWRAVLDPANPEIIAWNDLGEHPGPSRYRAAGGDSPAGGVWFHGGTDVPYNINGLAYADRTPAPPSGSTLAYDLGFTDLPVRHPIPTMDHRSLARCGNTLFLLGGMTAGPTVTPDVWSITTQ